MYVNNNTINEIVYCIHIITLLHIVFNCIKIFIYGKKIDVTKMCKAV